MIPAATPRSSQLSNSRSYQPPSSRDKAVVVAEFAIVALIFVADWKHLVPVSKTPFLLLLGWISIRLRGLRWRDLGFRRYKTWLWTFLIGCSCGIAIELFELFISQPALMGITGKPPDLSDFYPLIGNAKLLALTLAGAWSLAAFGEEFVYRGYLINRAADVGGGSGVSWAVSLGVISLVFGLAHTYQEITGVAENAIDGFILGAIYLACGRNLAVPVIAHGVTDTVDLLLIYFGEYPTLPGTHLLALLRAGH